MSKRRFCFDIYKVFVSMAGVPVGDVPSMKRDIPAVVWRISRDLFIADIGSHAKRLAAEFLLTLTNPRMRRAYGDVMLRTPHAAGESGPLRSMWASVTPATAWMHL
ncbi:hypothetical protein ACFFYR_31415 [Paraburkholderia dipogonis]|uniref:hypothetical protein n=1 Tax=Paraburkholderia dipogonis TaxID=1211383 RepID=UPI001FCB9B03|nr:hypothetical protein [Paraburkholderia dipogonis]